MKALYLAGLVATLTGCAQSGEHEPNALKATPLLSASEVIRQAKADEWQRVSAQNILKITLPTGSAYIALNPQLAPNHTAHIKKLAREGFYKGTSVYRFVEGFVAQGGDSTGNKKIKTANKTVPAEFYLPSTQPVAITEVGGDGYAARSGFLNGFAVAQNQTRTHTWQVHCNGVFAMARDNDINSAATEFFVTIGQGPRYLDKNITVFGRVLDGMEHFNRLQRTPTKGVAFNPITDLQVLADIEAHDTTMFKVLKTDSAAFKRLIAARKNRSEAWFVHSANYIDVCALAIPTERSAHRQ